MNHEKEIRLILERNPNEAYLEFLLFTRRICCDYLNGQTDEIASTIAFVFKIPAGEAFIQIDKRFKKLKKGMSVTTRTEKELKIVQKIIRIIDKMILKS